MSTIGKAGILEAGREDGIIHKRLENYILFPE